MAQTAVDSIVLTGCGWVTPFAVGSIGTVLAAAHQVVAQPDAGRRFWAVPEDRLAACPEVSKELKSERGAWMTAVAFEHARRQAGLGPESVAPERLGLALGCALAGQLGMIDFANEVREQTARFVSPIHFPQTVGNYIAGALARGYNFRGPNTTLAEGIASGIEAIIEACRLLGNDEADVVFAGGTDSLSDALALGLGDGGGLLSEGACLFVLERAEHAQHRGVAALAGVLGYTHPAVGDLAGPLACSAGWHGFAKDEPVAGPWADPCPTRGSPAQPCVVSGAGVPFPGAVWIEYWVGCCFAALSAGAVAAGIGAACGREVPLREAARGSDVSVGRVAVPASSTPTRLVVAADADGAHVTMLELAIAAGR